MAKKGKREAGGREHEPEHRETAAEAAEVFEEQMVEDEEGEERERQLAAMPEAARHRLQRVRAFAKEHPTVALLIAAGAGAVVGAEFAFGAAVGVTAATLLTRRTGGETRAELRRLGKEALEQGSGPAGSLWHHGASLLRRRKGAHARGEEESKTGAAAGEPEPAANS